ncbi:DUF11 domain-containing protein [candidate division KSB1 bacterium]|nr:DUF11 domain-containing protein [candidate division KSB1 bacterium]
MRVTKGFSHFFFPIYVLIISVIPGLNKSSAIASSEVPVMDMRIRQGNMTTDGSTVTQDIWVDLRTIDGSNWNIVQIQNSIILDPHFLTLVSQVDSSDWAFVSSNYTTHFRYTPQGGVIEFAANHKLTTPFVNAGGPDSLGWKPVFKFSIKYNPDPGQTGIILWYESTPHINIRAFNQTVTTSVTIHRKELGAPLAVPLEYICYTDIELSLGCDKTELVIGDSGSYTLTVFNQGECDATGIRITSALPVLLAYDHYTATSGSYLNTTGQWNLGSLAVGDSAKLTLFYDARYDGYVNIEGSLNALDQTDLNPDNNRVQMSIRVDRLRVMDMRVRKGQMTGEGSNGVLELFFDVRTTDGSERMIVQMQNAIKFDPLFNSLITNVELVECVFSESSYSRFWRYTDVDSVLEFQFAHKDFMLFTSLGGPDSSDWHTILKFNVHYNIIPDVFATINWFNDTPHYNVRAVSIPPGRTELIHNERLGTPLVFKIDNFVDLQLRLLPSQYSAYVGDDLTLTTMVSNIGNQEATGIQVSSILPAGFMVRQYFVTQGVYDPLSRQWEVGSLEPGFSCSLELIVELLEPGQLSTVSHITHLDQADSDLTNNIAHQTISVTRGLMDMRIALGNFYSEGEMGTVELNIDVRTIDGSQQYIEQIQNAVVLDEHFSSLVTAVDTSHWALGGGNYSRFWGWFPADGVIEFMATQYSMRPATALGGPDSTVWHRLLTFTIMFTMDPAKSGIIDWFDDTPQFNIRAYSDPNQVSEIISRYELGAPISLPLYLRETDVAVVQHVDNPEPERGERIVLTLEVENLGPTTATNIIIRHQLPNVLDIVSTEGDGAYDVQSKIWTLDQLEASQRAEMRLTIVVEQAGLFASILDVQGMDQTDPDTTNNHSELFLSVGNPVMDMRVDITGLHGNGSNIFVELSVDVRTIDGSSRIIESIQNSLVFDQNLLAAIRGITLKEWRFSDNDYLNTWTYTEFAGVLEFQTTIRESGEPLSFGGPDSSDWAPVVVFNIELEAVEGQVGVINWYAYTPHFNVRAVKSDLSEIENIQRSEMGCPAYIPLDYRSKADLEVAIETEASDIVQHDVFTLNFSLENKGPNDAHNVKIRQTIPAGLELQNWSGDGIFDQISGDWTVGDIEAGSTTTMTVNLLTVSSGDLCVESKITNLFEFDPDTSNNHVQNCLTVIPAVRAFIRVYLEGPYRFAIQFPNHPDPELMATSLRYCAISGWNCVIPLKSPYADSLVKDPGVTDPNELPDDIVDWIFIQVRTAKNPGSPDLVLGNGVNGVSCFLRDDGAVIDVDGSEGVLIPGIAEGSYYFVIDHRNHLKVMSSAPINTLEMTAYNFDVLPKSYYDFTESKGRFFTVFEDDQRGCHFEPVNGKWLVGAGDGDKAHQVENTDFDVWYKMFGANGGYFQADYDLGGMVEGFDQTLVFDNLLLRSPFSWLDVIP